MNKRTTFQKELVLRTVRKLHGHVTADEVYAAAVAEYAAISKGTVYRNLKILADEGSIRRVEISDGPDRYDFTITEHYHVQCVKCGAVFDVDMDAVLGLTERIRDAHGMTFLGYDILFKGICPSCQDTE
ncbi:MAG: transcriptional repressor [Oscillospiraceae bacterium]|nr:transcriptional repressor [Oscillospiraceae bacterium]